MKAVEIVRSGNIGRVNVFAGIRLVNIRNLDRTTRMAFDITCGAQLLGIH